MAGKILILTTSYGGDLGDKGPTGSWVEEIASPYFLWRQQGFAVDIASIQGGEVPFDPASTSGDFCTQEAEAFLKSEDAQAAIKNTKSITDVLSSPDFDSYSAVFLPGGHGVCFDLPHSSSLKELIEKFWLTGKIVSAVCHGPVGLVSAAPNGEPLVKGKQVTGFTNTEEVAVGKDKDVPFLLEDNLKELGGEFLRGEDWTPFAVRDGNLITGQNPQSSKKVAELVAEAIIPVPAPQHGKGEGFHARGHPVTGEHHEHGYDKVPEHPQFHKGQAHNPVRQTTHTGVDRGGQDFSKAYVG